MIVSFIGGFLLAAFLFAWYSIISISSHQSRREEKEVSKTISKPKPPVNYCGEMPVAEDSRWNIFDGD